MASIAGKKARVKVTGSAVAFTNEATTDAGDHLTYTITNAAKRVFDPTAAIVVKEDGVVTAAPYTVNRLRGTVTFVDPTPFFTSATVGDAAWSQQGTPTRTAGAFLCSDGQTLDLIGDDDAAAAEADFRNLSFTGNGSKDIAFRIARYVPGGMATHRVFLSDITASLDRLAVNIDCTSAVPVVSILSSLGTLVSVTARGDGSYDVVCTAPGVIAANTNTLAFWPGSTTPSGIGSLYVGLVKAYNGIEQRGAGVAVSISGSYLPVSVAAKIKHYSWTLSAKNDEDSDFESGEFKTRTQTQLDVAGSLDGKWETASYWRDALLAGVPVVIEFFPDKSGAADLICWALLNKRGLVTAVDGLVEASVEFQGAADADGRAASVA